MVYLELAEQHILRVFVRYVSDHNRSAAVLFDVGYLDLEGVGLFCTDCSSVSD